MNKTVPWHTGTLTIGAVSLPLQEGKATILDADADEPEVRLLLSYTLADGEDDPIAAAWAEEGSLRGVRIEGVEQGGQRWEITAARLMPSDRSSERAFATHRGRGYGWLEVQFAAEGLTVTRR